MNLNYLFGDVVQINDQDQVLWRAKPRDGLIGFLIRQGTPGDFKLVAKTHYPLFDSFSPFEAPLLVDALFPWIALANDTGSGSRSVFPAISATDPTVTVLASPVDSTGAGGTSSASDYHLSGTLSGFPNIYPALSDNDLTVVRAGPNPTDDLIVFTDPTLVPAQLVAGSPDYLAVGDRASISDDGILISFFGDHATLGAGIFAKPGPSTTIKVAGVAGDGRIDPGEAWNDVDGDLLVDPGEDLGNFEPFGLQAPFVLEPRVGANLADAATPSVYTTTFLAHGRDPDQAQIGPLGLYASEVDLLASAGTRASPAVRVAEVGDSIPGLPGQVASISVYDPVNNGGDLVFATQSDAGAEAVVRAVPIANRLERWWATAGDPPLTITWSVTLTESSGTSYQLSVDMQESSDWILLPGTVVTVDGGDLSSPLVGSLQPVPVVNVVYTALIGPLDPGEYSVSFAVPVPVQADVGAVQLMLVANGTTSHRRLEGFLIADHQEQFTPFIVTAPGGGTQPISSAQQLVSLFAPALHFDSISERFQEPLDAQGVLDNPLAFLGVNRGNSEQEMDLSRYDDAVFGAQAIYGSVLDRAGVVPSRCEPSSTLPAAEIAVSYWFYYPAEQLGRAQRIQHPRRGLGRCDCVSAPEWIRVPSEPGRIRAAFEELLGIDAGDLRLDGGETVCWPLVELNAGGGPLVFVGLGGHASYPESGMTFWVTPALPDPIRPEYHRGFLPVVTAPAQYLGRVGGEAAANWLLYPGTWGANVSGPGNAAPSGPAFQPHGDARGLRWLDPWDWSDGFNVVPDPSLATIAGNTTITGSETTLITNGIDASVSFTFDVEAPTTGLYFEFTFDQSGDGDVLEVLIDGTPAMAFIGTDFPGPTSHAVDGIDLTPFNGSSVDVSIRLVSNGGVASQVQLDRLSLTASDYPDLTFGSIAYPTGGVPPGGALVIDVSVENVGSAELVPAPGLGIQAFLSLDASLDAGDASLGFVALLARIGSDESSAVQIAGAVPANQPAGVYYVILVVDEAEANVEMDESNNYFASASADRNMDRLSTASGLRIGWERARRSPAGSRRARCGIPDCPRVLRVVGFAFHRRLSRE